MQQLTGLDASFLYLETPNAPMHISSLSIYDQSTAPGGKVRFKEIIANFSDRLRRIPQMTRRLQTVPLSLDHPYWISDGHFDPEFHIRHIALPQPGDWRQLCILVSRLQALPLDRGRPLWETYVIEGLDNVEGVPSGSFALFTKTHHAAIDGTSGMEISKAIHDLSPEFTPPAEPTVVEVDRQPSRVELLARAQFNTLRQPFRMLSVARNTVPGFAKAYNAMRKGELQRVKQVPRTRFNNSVSSHRVFEAVAFDLEDIKAIKNAVPGATVNDAAIALVGGGLRHYLESHNELPEESTVALAPINVRSDKEKSGGNIVSGMYVQTRSDIADPLARLQAVHEGTRNAKELSHAIGARTMTDYSQFVPSTLTAQGAKLASRWGLMSRVNMLANCTITNVPGPQVPLYVNGARMVSNLASGPILDGLGLFQVISSYCGQFTVSVTSCREIMPDPQHYAACLRRSFDELKAVAAASKKGNGRASKAA